MEKVYIGMDVHCKLIYCVVQNDAGDVISEKPIPTEEESIKTFLSEIGNAGELREGTEIAFESGQQATWLSKFLSCIGMKPVIIDAREVRAKARRIGQKTDRRDAFEICDGWRRGIYDSIVYVPDEKIQKLRNILMQRRHYVNICTGEVNAAKYLMRANGMRAGGILLRKETGWEGMCEIVKGKAFAGHTMKHHDVWKVSAEKVKELELELKDALSPFKDVMDILMSTPCVGILTAATYIAVIGTPERFPDSSHVISYAGLATSTYDTGETERHGHITKRGSSELRAMLCEAAQHARNPRNPLNPYFTRACAKHGYKKAVIAVAHRLARILYQMWKRKECFDIGKLNLEQGEYQKVRKTYYRIKTPKTQVLPA
jgi:transposase